MGRLLNDNANNYDRKLNRDKQTAAYIQTRKGKDGKKIPVKGLRTRFENQAAKAGLDKDSNPTVSNMFTVQEPVKGSKIAEELHHIHPLRNFDGLFANTTDRQASTLQKILKSGDDIRNVMNMPRYAHQGIKGLTEAIHVRMRAAGVEHGGTKLHPVMQQMDRAHNAPFAEKVALAKAYNKQVRPKVEAILDDVLTKNEKMQDDILADARKGSDATASAMKDNQTYALMGKRAKAKEKAKAFGESKKRTSDRRP